MSNELTYHSAANTGDTLYAQLENTVGQVWNGSAFEAPVSANWVNYDVAMTEQATSTGIFRASMPAAAVGAYTFVVRKQAGGSPAVGDVVLGSSQLFYWSGTAVDALTLANINAEVDTALNTAIPGGPTADSVNERMVALDEGTAPPIGIAGTVDDGAPAVGDFDGDAALSASDNFYNNAFLVFTGGTLKGIGRQISGYNGTSKNFTFTGSVGDADEPFPVAPANTDPFIILGRFGA